MLFVWQISALFIPCFGGVYDRVKLPDHALIVKIGEENPHNFRVGGENLGLPMCVVKMTPGIPG